MFYYDGFPRTAEDSQSFFLIKASHYPAPSLCREVGDHALGLVLPEVVQHVLIVGGVDQPELEIIGCY